VSREPTSTYRIQLNPQFGFDAAADLVPYLKELGIDHLYCSPYFQAAPGSTHGYDVVDHSRANEELGGAPGHARMCAAIERNGMRQREHSAPPCRLRAHLAAYKDGSA
jgi:(1->4)-alpha-D-glucan 1-alpha-D-glucosylmutase